MKQTTITLLLLVLIAGCSSSQPAPKPLSSGPQLSDEEAKKALKDAEAKQLCSPENLKTATEEQKKKCDPTTGMFDNTKPKQADKKDKKNAPKQTPQSTPNKS